MELVPDSPFVTADNFVDFLYDGLQGYAYLVFKDPNDITSWNQAWFQWPEQRENLIHYIKEGSKQYETYLAPALFHNDNNAQRENVKVTNVVWTEFDGNAPDSYGDTPPSITVRSSTEGHDHVYWRLNTPISDVEIIEDINRRLAHNLQADSSAWDATQVLRPPGTINFKRGGLPTFVRDSNNYIYDTEVFDSLAPAPPPIDSSEWELGSLPDVSSVLLKYAFTETLVKLLTTEEVEEGQRSSKMMQFAFAACELGLRDVEVFVLLKTLDDRWGKFVGRRDRDKRLAGIVTYARNKYPEPEDDNDGFIPIIAMDYMSFLETDINIDWVAEPLLMEQGSLLMVGPSGIGKTQYLLELMKHMCLGKDFLHYKMSRPRKIGFLSLEMSQPELKIFLQAQHKTLTVDEMEVLRENFTIIPYGEPWALNKLPGQDALLRFQETYEWDGVFVDSVGSAISGAIADQANTQPYLSFVDRLRNREGLFYGAIHHTRKGVPGQSKGQDDVYGDQYFVNRASSVYALLPGKDKTIRVNNWKLRMAQAEDIFVIRRTENITFERINNDIANGLPPGNNITEQGLIVDSEGNLKDTAGKFGM